MRVRLYFIKKNKRQMSYAYWVYFLKIYFIYFLIFNLKEIIGEFRSFVYYFCTLYIYCKKFRFHRVKKQKLIANICLLSKIISLDRKAFNVFSFLSSSGLLCTLLLRLLFCFHQNLIKFIRVMQKYRIHYSDINVHIPN